MIIKLFKRAQYILNNTIYIWFCISLILIVIVQHCAFGNEVYTYLHLLQSSAFIAAWQPDAWPAPGACLVAMLSSSLCQHKC